jgi:hypothetical protein
MKHVGYLDSIDIVLLSSKDRVMFTDNIKKSIVMMNYYNKTIANIPTAVQLSLYAFHPWSISYALDGFKFIWNKTILKKYGGITKCSIIQGGIDFW